MKSSSFASTLPTRELHQQVALVTGATSGLGWRFAHTLATAGAIVVGAGRRLDRLEALEISISSSGGRCERAVLDVTDHNAIEATLATIERDLGPVTILINNAGIPDAQRAHRMPIELIDAVLATNVRGPYILSCAVARRLIAERLSGRIVNISSMAAFHYDGIGAALYSTTKAALNRMTEALAVEWAKYRINVNAIAPGTFASEMTNGGIERMGDPSPHLPRQRIGDPAQLDSTLLYLCAPASECVTGTIVKVDDGQLPR